MKDLTLKTDQENQNQNLAETLSETLSKELSGVFLAPNTIRLTGNKTPVEQLPFYQQASGGCRTSPQAFPHISSATSKINPCLNCAQHLEGKRHNSPPQARASSPSIATPSASSDCAKTSRVWSLTPRSSSKMAAIITARLLFALFCLMRPVRARARSGVIRKSRGRTAPKSSRGSASSKKDSCAPLTAFGARRDARLLCLLARTRRRDRHY